MMDYDRQEKLEVVHVNRWRSLTEHFAGLEDPRAEHLVDHELVDIIIAICGAVCGAKTWTDIELFGQQRRSWLEQFLDMSHGVLSHDTFGRVFSRIDAVQFQRCFVSWVQAVFHETNGQVVAVDGKTVRRSHDRNKGQETIRVVSAWATVSHLVLAQQKINEFD